MAAVGVYQSPDDDGVFYDDDGEDEEYFYSSHLSGSEGNVAASASSGSAERGNENGKEPEIYPIKCWYHGRLSRTGAEKLLSEADLVPGTYLVRQSDRRPRNYVLSFVSSSKNILHFQINTVCGHYFISQLEFASLPDLVRHFSLNAVIGGSEKLVHPLPPSSLVELEKQKVVTLVPFCAMKDTDELSFMKGDVLLVDEDFDNGWIWATSEITKESGLVYSGLTENLAACNKTPEKLLYVHSQLSRQEAVSLLAKAGPGSYLVTPSESTPGNYTLLVNCGQKVERFQIRRLETGYEIGGRCFDGLHDIIDRYSELSICADIRLTSPAPKFNPALDNNNLDGDLYQKLRSNRLNSKSSCPDAIKCGYLNFKARKRWKTMYFLLKDIEGQLFCYENEKRAKPKIVLDLFCCTLYLVHTSLFNQPYCFELIQNGFAVALYFQASTAYDHDDWISLLRPLCCGNRHCPSPFSSVRQDTKSSTASNLRKLCRITIRVNKAKQLPVKENMEVSAVVSLNEATVCRTCWNASNGTVVWDEKFVFDDFPNDMNEVSVTIFSKTKKSREVKIGSFRVPISCDEYGAFVLDDWFDVQTTGPSWRHTNQGQCHVMIDYHKEAIMPREEYRSLADLIRNDNFSLCHYLNIACVEDRQKLAESLLLYYESDAVLLVIEELKREIDGSDDVRMLFRSGSLAVALMDELLIREGQHYATSVLKSGIEGLVTSKITFEVDQCKTDKASASSNAATLLHFANIVFNRICDSAGKFPSLLCGVLGKMKETVCQKWPEDPLVAFRAVSSFVFLRLFCLILVFPRQYLLISENSPPCCYRNLVLIAKVIQSAANFSDVAAKRDNDALSTALAAFSVQIRPRMITFLNAISDTTAGTCHKLSTSPREADPARHLATIYHICQKYVNENTNLENKHPSLKNLCSVLELLKCHEKRYIAGPTVSVV